jgi:hypothetical protein
MNASLEDDAEYQCQVGPAKTDVPIRASANLTVICEYTHNLYDLDTIALVPLKYFRGFTYLFSSTYVAHNMKNG